MTVTTKSNELDEALSWDLTRRNLLAGMQDYKKKVAEKSIISEGKQRRKLRLTVHDLVPLLGEKRTVKLLSEFPGFRLPRLGPYLVWKRNQAIVLEYVRGGKVPTIAKRFGLLPQNIYRVLHQEKVTMREAHKNLIKARRTVPPALKDKRALE